MYLGLLLKVDVSDESNESQEAFALVLILAHVLMIATVLVQTALSAWEMWYEVDESVGSSTNSASGQQGSVNQGSFHVNNADDFPGSAALT